MKSKLNAILAVSAVAFSLAGTAHAQQPSGKMDMNEMMKGMTCCDKMSPGTGTAGASVATAAVFADGEVRKVDKESKKITLKHGEIKNLEMPGMTMAFAVKDVAMLDKLKVGDKVQFKVVDDGGKLTVVEIQGAK